MTTDYDAQQAIAALRQKQYADQAQYQAPQGRMAGHRYIAPHALEYIGSALRSLGGMRGQDIAGDELQSIQKARQGAVAEALRNFGQAARGVQGVAGSPEIIGNNPSAYVPAVEGRAAVAPDMNQAYSYLLESPDQAHRQAGLTGIGNIPIQEEKKAQFREQLESKRELAQMGIDSQLRATQMGIDSKMQLAQMLAANRPQRQAQIVETGSGLSEYVGGKLVPIMGTDGKQATGKGGAGVATSTRSQDARDALATIDMAEKLIGQATGSGIGSAVDATAAFFGASTKGAQAAARLKALEGDLISKMPKMSGPQSDKDVLLYKQQAGQIGDPSIPPDTKLAALTSIREMQVRYSGGGSRGASGSFATPSQAQNVDALLNKYP